MSRPLRILFLHGFESGPHGIKVKRLRALPNVQVVAPQMEVAKYRSPLHNPHLMALGVFALATLSLVGISVYLWNAQGRPPVLARVSWFSAGVSVAVVAGAAVAARAIWRSAVRYVIDSSLKVQIDAVRAHRPDILVGSSFGGGLIAHLVNKQIWHGPAVLLAPAHTRIQRHLDNSDFVFDEHAFQFVDSRRRRSADIVAAEAAAPPSDLSLPLNLGLLLIHPTHDAQVPFADSIRLLRDTVERDPLFPIKLVEEPDDNHDLNKVATTEQFGRWIHEALRLGGAPRFEWSFTDEDAATVARQAAAAAAAAAAAKSSAPATKATTTSRQRIVRPSGLVAIEKLPSER